MKNAKEHLLTKNSRLAHNRALASAVAVSSAALWTGFASAPAHAATDAGALFTAGTTNGSRADGPYTIGTQFTVSGNTTITELGVQDQNNGNGTVGYTNTGTAVTGFTGVGNTTVGIWNGNGTLIAEAIVTKSDLLGAGDYRYDTTLYSGNGTTSPNIIPSLTLSAGNYTIGAVVGVGVVYFNDAASATAGATSVTVGNASYASGGTTLTEPNTAGGGGTGRWAPANGYISTALTAGVGNSTSTDYSIADSGGTLTLNSSSTPGVASLQIAAAGGTLDLGANTFTIANNYLEMTGTGNYTIQDGTLSGGNSTQSLVVIQAGTGTLNLNSVIGGGAAGFVKLGNGTAVMGAANTYSGATEINAGTLKLSGSGTLGSGSSSLIVNSGGTVDLNGTSQSTGALSGNGGLVLNNNSGTIATLVVGNGNATGSYAGVIEDHSSGTGTLGLTKIGTGTETLTAAATYSGATIVSSGNLTLSGSGAIASTSAITVASGATLNLGGSGNNELTQTVAWTANGTIAVTGSTANSMNAGATLNGGALTSTVTNGTIYGAFYINNSATVTANGTGNTISGIGNFGINAGQTLTLSTPQATDSLTVSTVLFGVNGSAALLTKTGLGTVILTGTNTYTGSTTVNGGTLQIGNGTSGSIASTSALVLGGGNFSLMGHTSGTTAQTVASLSLTAGTSSVISLYPNGGTGTTLTITSNTITTGSGASINFNYANGNTTGSTVGNDIVVWGNNTSFLTNGIIGTAYTVTDTGGTGIATVNGSGDVIRLNSTGLPVATGGNSSNYAVNQSFSTGNTSTPGSLVEALSGNVAAYTVSVDTTGLSSGANLALGINSLAITGGGGIVFAGANPYTISATGAGGITSPSGGALTFNNISTGNVTLSAPILASGTNAVTFAGNGITILTGTSTYSGTTTIGSTSTLQIGGAGVLGSGNYGGAITDNGTLEYSSSGNQTLSGGISGSGSLIKDTGNTSVLTLTAANSYSGPTTVSAGTLTLSGSGALANTSAITIASGATLNLGAGVNPIQSNAASPALTINGTLTATSSTATTIYPTSVTLNNGTMTSTIANTSSFSAFGTYFFGTAGVSRTITANGSANYISGVGSLGIDNLSVLTLNTPLTTDALTISALLISVSDAGGTMGGLAKTGSGLVILSGASTYSGGTTISAGTLLANYAGNATVSSTGTGSVTVSPSTASVGNSTTWYTGGKLGGNGSVAGTVTLTGSSVGPKLGGIIAAGASGNATSGIGTLTTGNETWGQGAAYQWKINTAGTAAALGNTTTVTSGLAGNATGGYDFLKIGTAASGSLLSVLPTGNTAFTIDPIGNITVTPGATYNWTIAQIGSGNQTQITIPQSGNATAINPSTTQLNSSIFALDTSSLTINGSNNSYLSNSSNFGVYFETVGANNDLVLSYNSTPEPGTALLVLTGAVPMLTAHRRRRLAK